MIAILDYGAGNLRSVAKALETVELESRLRDLEARVAAKAKGDGAGWTKALVTVTQLRIGRASRSGLRDI